MRMDPGDMKGAPWDMAVVHGDMRRGPWEHGGVSLGACRVPVNTRSLTLSLQVQNDQCQPTVEESRWMRTTEKGWEFHSVSVRWEVTLGEVPRCCPGVSCPCRGTKMLHEAEEGAVGGDRRGCHTSPSTGASPLLGSGISHPWYQTHPYGILLPGGAEPWKQRAVLADHRLLRLVQGA